MPTNVNVCINGFVLSTLIFDCGNDGGDQEGFLYGSVTRNVRSEINDQSMNNTQEDILISICSSVPCGSFLSFYNNVGEVNREELEQNIGERKENIVGWYRFRRYSPMYPSIREQVTHRNLRSVFARHNMDDQFFVFGILSSSNLTNFATHSFDYAFFTQRMDSTFRHLNFTILNLGDTRNTYRAGSMALPFMNSSSFNSVLSSSWNFNTFYDTEDQIQQFHNRLRNKLECLQEELAASDAVNQTLEDDIRRLSNEMQSLLATQERLSIAAAREKEATDTSETVETRESSDSNEESMDLKEKECTVSKDDETKMKEHYDGQADKGSQQLKRPVVELLDNIRSTKRVCSDTYFENEENQSENLVDKDTDSVDENTPECSPKHDDNIVSVLVIDPDSGELSAAQFELDVSSNLEVQSYDIIKSMVPSPTLEIAISDINTIGNCNISSSEESSNIKPPFIVYASKEAAVPEICNSSTSANISPNLEEPMTELPMETNVIEISQTSPPHEETEEDKKEDSQKFEESKQ